MKKKSAFGTVHGLQVHLYAREGLLREWRVAKVVAESGGRIPQKSTDSEIIKIANCDG